MGQSLSLILLHIIFSTKYRRSFIKPPVERELYAYMSAIIQQLGGVPFLINGHEDHVHILTTLPRTISASKLVEEVKRNSSRWIKTKGETYQTFSWQSGFAAFSVSISRKKSVLRYISNQKYHHRKRTFQEELLELLETSGVEYDEQYLWD